ncbi:phosphoserine phosphatase SerB [Mesorhizobium sp. NBSH29]|uniref:phosphoserine phosphatase SerB n=1 Tax=Mesorhizobium sp. NBSH29 TaxID=2654249 RepID=UPI0018965328|nr:phosphoserine phosphatase SerB [Mesorhizobium sp. NBSH29]QPC88162.1 phosphoserine phosphatase SerB [Mesorhizobium sp. NBSH29]
MSLIATLISHPADRMVLPDLAHKAAIATGASAIDWLAENVACDLQLPANAEPHATETALRAAIGDLPVDIVVQQAATRRKKILIADMDSTMIEQECIDELADEVGIKGEVAEITRRSMNGEIEFEPALRQRVALLKGLDATVVSRILATRIKLRSGGRELVGTMRKHGAWTALVSGGFDVFAAPIAAMLGFDENRANHLVEANGRFEGSVTEPILDRVAKATALHAIAADHGLNVGDAIAVGDGANDLDMIHLAGMGVALHAKPFVACEARARIDHGDLTALLYLQGYRHSEFIA